MGVRGGGGLDDRITIHKVSSASFALMTQCYLKLI